jgi:hypothetical protein
MGISVETPTMLSDTLSQPVARPALPTSPRPSSAPRLVRSVAGNPAGEALFELHTDDLLQGIRGSLRRRPATVQGTAAAGLAFDGELGSVGRTFTFTTRARWLQEIEAVLSFSLHGVSLFLHGRLSSPELPGGRCSLTEPRLYVIVGAENASGRAPGGESAGTQVDAYLAGRFPRLQARGQQSLAEVRELFQSSGYLDLRQAQDMPFSRWHRPEVSGAVNRDVVYRAQDGRLVGHVSVTEIYPRTWMLHQLATLGGHAETGRCRMALYDFVSSLPTAAQGESAGVLAYFNPERRWHQASLQDFTRWVNRPSRAVMTHFDRFEHDPTVPQGDVTAAPEVEIRVGQPGDLAGAATLIRSQLPALVADAMDIQPGRLMTGALTAGLPGRARTMLVLRVKGRLAGVALCESGPRELSLFNLMNLAQFYVCTGERAPSTEAQLALLAAVRGLYRQRGVSDPIIVAPTGTFAAACEPGTRLEEAMGCVVIAGKALRQWATFLRLQLGRLYDRAGRAEAVAAGPRRTAPARLSAPC